MLRQGGVREDRVPQQDERAEGRAEEAPRRPSRRRTVEQKGTTEDQDKKHIEVKRLKEKGWDNRRDEKTE